MQINSIPAYRLGVTRNLTARAAETQEPTTPVQTQEPASEPVKSIYFGSNDNGHAMRNATMAILIPTGMLMAAGGLTTSCGDKEVVDSLYIEAKAEADADANADANANAGDSTKIDSTSHHNPNNPALPDTVIQHDTVFIDTTECPECDCNIYRPIPLDTLAKHVKIWDIDGSDTIKNRNVVHYEYVREWEYNNKVIADMNMRESSMDKNVLIHDIEVKDYKGDHISYGKHVRRIPTYPVNIQNYDGTTKQTKKGIFLEIYKNPADIKGASIFNSELETRYFLQTAGDSVKVYKYIGGNDYVEDGRMGKGYLDDNTILMKDMIGEYATDEHLVDFKIKNITDDELKELMIAAVTEANQSSARTRGAEPRRRSDESDPNSINKTFGVAAWRKN